MDGGRYDVNEFKNRHLTLPALDDDCVQPESLLSRSALQVNATTKCISAAHSILDCFIEVPTERLQRVPNVIFVRAIYALVALMKADYAVGTDPEMGELLESQSLKVDYYLNTIIARTTEAIGPQQCRLPMHWKFVLEAKLKSWRDEYRTWREKKRHLKRRKVTNESGTATGDQTPTFAEPGAPFQQSAEQQAPLMPNFALANPYQNFLPLDPTNTGGQLGDASTFSPDIGDFTAAFQNGDLYLLNDMTVDSFGGWMPPTGYGGLEFGSFNGQGF